MPEIITRPQADGSVRQLVTVVGAPSPYLAVDDSLDATHDSDATYLTMDSGGGPLAVSKVSFPVFFQADGLLPTQVTVRRAAKSVGGSPTFRRGFIKGSTIGFAAGNMMPTGSYAVVNHAYATNPITGESWTEDDLEGLEVYFEGHPDFIGTMRLTMVNVIVDYVPATNWQQRDYKYLRNEWPSSGI